MKLNNNGDLKALEEVLLEISQIFSKWGIRPSDWILALHYAEILQGYKIKKSLRPGHFNIFVRTSRIPWQVDKNLIGVETNIPNRSRYDREYKKFQKKSGFNFDLIPYLDRNFSILLKQHSFKYKLKSALTQNKEIFLLDAGGSLMVIEKHLDKHFEKIGEKAKRIFTHLQEIAFSAKKMHNISIYKKAQSIIKKYKGLVSEKPISKNLLANIQELKGVATFKTNQPILGTTLVIKNPDQPNITAKITQDCVLVCPRMAQPLIFLVTGCKAIIADDGGILSHAAIISRELKKPCIINTKIATKVLKDGDMVKIDTQKGTILIVK
ncbi:MAG: PEP-utilizing enzyme [Patescibacteria group bacterium]|nr:PEP-utilizing enzyme [Patescibacteria group bacterium]